MATSANWRLDPFTNEYLYKGITDEVRTVGFDFELARYGFRLDEAPRIFASGDSLTVVENVTGGATWTEISSSIAPSAGDYRLDKTFDTGFVEFNSADNGKSFLVTYSGKGSITNFNNLQNAIETFSPLEMEGDLSTVGDASIGGDLTVTGNAILNDTLTATSLVGTVIAYAGSGTPTGWLFCDGSAYDTTIYARLFAVIGYIYGGSTGGDFNIPDYRGEFLRGLDDGKGTDPDSGARTDRGDGITGDAVGTQQAGAFETHTHGVTFTGSSASLNISGAGSVTPAGSQETDSTGGNETRPTNIYVRYLINSGV